MKRVNQFITLPVSIFWLLLMLSPCFGKEITLSWAASEGATGYRIYCQGNNPNPPFPLCGDTGNTNTTHTLKNLEDGKLYSFAVTAYNAYGESAYSNVVTESPGLGSAPPNVVTENPPAANGDEGSEGTPQNNEAEGSGASRIGFLTGQVEVTQEWQTVTLPRSFADPIVILGPPGYRDAAAGVARIRHVRADSFEIQFREWDYLDGVHGAETVSYLVMEEGRYTMPDGGVWEAGSFFLSSSGVLNGQVYTAAFSGVPTLLLTAQTGDEEDKPVTVRAGDVTNSGFNAGLYTQETLLGSHAQEKVGYVAVFPPGDGGVIASVSRDLSYTVSQLEVGGAFMQTDGFALRLEEEQSADAEVTHVPETIHLIRINNNLFAQTVTVRETDPVTCRQVEGSWSPAAAAKVGIRRGSNWRLKQGNSDAATAPAFSFGFNDVQPGDRVFAGDWNGDGVATIGVRRGSTFHLRHSNSSGAADQVFNFGRSSDQVIIGDWNGDGVDTIGVKRGSIYYLKNRNDSSPAEISFRYGFRTSQASDVALAGDWNGDGMDSIGLKRRSIYYLRNGNSAGPPDYSFAFGSVADMPLVGDWDGNRTDTIGVKRGNVYHLRNSNSSGPEQITFTFGENEDLPFSGKW